MDALTALHARNSVNLLSEPGPTAKQLEAIYQAGLRACDHGGLTPWKYLRIEGDGRKDFGELMVKVKEAMDGQPLEDEAKRKLRSKPLRAPLILVVVATVQEDHPKIPVIEQVMSAAASAQMMMTAAHAQGIGAIWRSGNLMFAPQMRTGLGLASTDQIVGFLYLGTPMACKDVPKRDSAEFVSSWPDHHSA